mmetsp:Transcript_47291/g.102687  ORF Transcript_47291/g.102687 Transcript_47291/m.102687 type:complete len:363 (-) Transcript_47291:493-1581(-)
MRSVQQRTRVLTCCVGVHVLSAGLRRDSPLLVDLVVVRGQQHRGRRRAARIRGLPSDHITDGLPRNRFRSPVEVRRAAVPGAPAAVAVGDPRNVYSKAHRDETGGERADEWRHERKGDEVVWQERADLRLHYIEERLLQGCLRFFHALPFRERREHQVEPVRNGCPNARVEDGLHDDKVRVGDGQEVDVGLCERSQKWRVEPGGKVSEGRVVVAAAGGEHILEKTQPRGRAKAADHHAKAAHPQSAQGIPKCAGDLLATTHARLGTHPFTQLHVEGALWATLGLTTSQADLGQRVYCPARAAATLNALGKVIPSSNEEKRLRCRGSKIVGVQCIDIHGGGHVGAACGTHRKSLHYLRDFERR